jgi:pimeloyl-ACP methyl ester carboxylesterase
MAQRRGRRSRALVLKDVRALEAMRLRRKARRGRNLFFLLIFAALFILGFNRVTAYEDGITRSSFTLSGTYPVPVLEMRPASGETPLVAIVAHGFAGSKELMTSFGVELARAGITAYLFDFPGHGASPVAIPANSYNHANGQINLTALSEVVDYARTHNAATRTPRLILLGHSMGTAAVGDYALAHPDPALVATILVSPVGQEHPTTTQPRNLLLLAGQDDLPTVLSDSTRLQRLGCGVASSQSLPVQCGDPAAGTGRRSVVLAGLNHITILTASPTFQEMLNWLHVTSPRQVSLGTMNFDTRLLWLLLAIVGVVLAFFPLSAILIDMFDIIGTPRSINGQNVLFFFFCTLIGIAAAIAIQYNWRPFSFLHILLSDYVGGYFFFVALVTAGVIFLIRRTLPLPVFREVGRQLFVALLLAVILYYTLGQLSTFAWQRFALIPQRFWRVPILFVLVWPLFLLDEGISRGYQEHGALRAIFASIFFKLLLLAGLVASIVLIPGLGFLSILLPVLALIFVFLLALCIQIYSSGRAALTSATFCALFLAWIMATTFPMTS